MAKEFWKSKTIWVNVLVVIAGVAAALADHITAGGVVTLTGLLNIALRAITNQAVSFK